MAVSPSTAHNFDPNSFNGSDLTKNKDGYYVPTDYQAALELRKFIKENLPDGFMTGDQLWELTHSGTLNGKPIDLDEKDMAVFEKLQGGLFARLDAGSNGTHDNVVGIKDIDDAIRTPWKLHGDAVSDDHAWSDPKDIQGMAKSESKQSLQKAFQDYGTKGLSTQDIATIINKQMIWSENEGAYKNVDDPNLIRAALALQKASKEVDGNHDGLITGDELNNWVT